MRKKTSELKTHQLWSLKKVHLKSNCIKSDSSLKVENTKAKIKHG